MYKEDYYKMFQVTECLINNYGYKNVIINDLIDDIFNENWLINTDDKNYQAIRVTMSTPSESGNDEQIQTYLKFFENRFNMKNIKFLDIHICKEKYDKNVEIYDFTNLDIEYFDGIDIKNIYPLVCECMHTVDDADKEVDSILEKMRKKEDTSKGFKKLVKKIPKKNYICTLIIISICIINFILNLYLKYKYDDNTAIYVLLGADYKTFTLGMKQFYRLITYAFVHADIIHLLCNMFSLYYVGRYVEIRYGHFKYLLILFYSILLGALTQGILVDNSICVGMSAGIYGLMIVFIGDMISSRVINLRALIPTLLINLFLNFLSTTAWTAHLGGAIGGFIIYYLIKNPKKIIRTILAIIVILSLSVKYVTISSINTLYGGTDLKVIEIFNDLGFENYSKKILIKLLNVYEKYGG